MFTNARRVFPVATVLAVALVAAGCSSAEPEAVSSKAPEVSSCWNFTAEQIAAPSVDAPAVDCTSEHTLQTFVVGSMSSLPDDAGQWTDAAINKDVAKTCTREALASWLELSTDQLAITRMSGASFVPTPEQAKQGATWLRCDAYLKDAGRAQILAASFNDNPERDRTDAWADCRIINPQAIGDQSACRAGGGQWKAAAAPIIASSAAPWPGTQTAQALTLAACSKALGGLGLKPTQWTGYAPDQGTWENIEKRATCFVVYESDSKTA